MSATASDNQRPLPSRFFSLAELEKLLGISDVTLWRIRRRKGFPKPYRVGGRLRYREDDIIEYLEGNRA